MARGGYWSLVEPIWDRISIYDGSDVFLEQYEAAPVAARTLLAAHWCQSEVRNGGFHQFFSNSTGLLAPEAIVAYRILGMLKIADTVEEATRWFGATYPREREPREKMLDRYENDHPEAWNPFEPLDDEFFEMIDIDNGGFVQAADRYAETHHA